MGSLNTKDGHVRISDPSLEKMKRIFEGSECCSHLGRFCHDGRMKAERAVLTSSLSCKL